MKPKDRSRIDQLIASAATTGVICPCCGGHFDEFLPYGIRPRPNAKCPRCGSKARHRLLWLYVRHRTNLLTERLTVLHLAPERSLRKTLATLPNLTYVGVDLRPGRAMVRTDVTRLSFRDRSFDAILCSHVLEHVPDDRRAMRELFRVLKPGGWAILQTPTDPQRKTTLEDPSIVRPEDRERVFGHSDHVRIYGRDYKDRLEGAGFVVRLDRYARELEPELVRTYGLKRDAVVWLCARPRAKDSLV